jgi:hypothetical protein
MWKRKINTTIQRKVFSKMKNLQLFNFFQRKQIAKVYKACKIILRKLRKTVVITLKHFWRGIRFSHHHLAHKPHLYLLERLGPYRRWHQRRFHSHVHIATALSVFVIALGLVFTQYQGVRALSDLLDTWNFSTPSDYVASSGVELNGSSAKLKAQNYADDANTAALYHFDENSGSTAADSSSHANNGTVTSGSFTTGNLNKGLSFNGNNSKLSVPDSASLGLTQKNTLESWTKLNNSILAGSGDRRQSIVDKGDYQLYYDNETGKVTYELADSTANTWTQQAGNDIKGSWDQNGKLSVNAQQYVGGKLYVGLGNAVGDAEVWVWNGSVWSQVGGDAKNSSWADQTYENVSSMAVVGTTLYAGLGSTAGDGEVWSCDTSTGCASWSKIGGDGINNGWAVNTIEEVTSMSVMNGSLYVGLGSSANDAKVYLWNGTSWTWVGGFGITGSYNAFTTGYEAVYSMTNDGTNLYVGFGSTAGDGDVWKLSGTTWTQIGGDASNSSWPAATIETVISMRYVGNKLYAGLGTTAGDAEVWSWNGTSWSKIGGDGVNSSWAASTYEGVYSFADDGTNLYAGLGASAGDNEVYKWNGTSWSKIGGDGVNGSFTNTHTIVQSMIYANNKLYTGLQAASNNAEEWAYDGSSWDRIGGGYINKSWGYLNLQDVEVMVTSGDYLYAGTGNTVAGNAQVWRFDGATWQLIGGQGVNGSWAPTTYRGVLSMISSNGKLYVGTGTVANDGDVWEWDGSTWTQVGGDGIRSGWGANFEEVDTLASFGGKLYAGLGSSANDAEIWVYDGSNWSKMGGDSINSGWTANYERVASMAVLNNKLYAGLGSSTGDAEVWEWDGSSWSKLGGDGVNSSWNTVYEQVESMTSYNGKLYAGLGNSTGDSELWEWNGSDTWTQIGGDGVNGSWQDGQYEQTKTLAVYNGKMYAGLGNSAGDGEVWEYASGTWNKIGGNGVNGGWGNTIETVQSFSAYKGKLYAGLGNTASSDAQIWSYGNNGFLQTTTSAQDTNWHHIAATYDGTTMKLYIDGHLDGSKSVTLSLPNSGLPLLIGAGYGGREYGKPSSAFDGALDELRISNINRSGFTSQPYSTDPQTVTLASAIRPSGVWHWDSLADSVSGGTANYRLSSDGGTTWQYWDGSNWVTSSGATQANTISEINAHISIFPVTFGGLLWQAILSGDGSHQITLSSLALNSTADYTSPSASSVAISAEKVSGGSALTSNSWTNDSSPAFNWTTGSDSESGVKGYCAYLGSDSTADPSTTKGILGSDGIATGNHCQYVTDGASLDLSVAGTVATALATSNNSYYLNLKAIDKAGNVSSERAQFKFRFDNTAPSNPTYISAPSGFVSNKAVTLSWATTGASAPDDANSGLVGLQYRIGSSGTWYGANHSGTGTIDDVLPNSGSYIMKPTPDFPNLVDGINTVYFRAWDVAGNVSTAYTTAAIKLNTSGAPSEPRDIIASPATSTTNSFSFSWDEPATFVGDKAHLTYCYSVNSLPDAGNCNYTGAGVTSLGTAAYATKPGTNTIYIVAKDESDNINYASYGTASFSANTAAPGIPLNTDIVDVSIKATQNWRLALTWDEPASSGSGGISSYQIYRSSDGARYTSVGSSASTTYIDAGLQKQLYYYRVKACDNTNNCGAQSTIVSATPTGRYTEAPNMVAEPTVSNVTTKKATIAWSTDRSSDSKIAIGTTSGKYGSSEISSSNQVGAHQIDLENLAAGTTYYYVAKWTDEDGNTGTSQEFSFQTAPPPVLKEISTTSVGLSSATIQFTSVNATKIAVYYGASQSFGGLKTINTSFAESTYTTSLDGLQDGTKYFYKLVSYDSEGNSYDGSVTSFTTPSRPKITNLVFQPVAGQPTSTQQVTWKTNVPSDTSVAYGKVGTQGTEVPQSDQVTDHSITITDLEDDSEYFLIARSRDRNGNLAVTDRQVFHTALDTRPPKISNITTESSVRGTGAEARGQIVVTWHTDELATSQVAYAEGSGSATFNNKTAEDTGLSFEHIVIVSDLPAPRVYSVQPVSHDRSGNQGSGATQSAIISRASDSVLTVVLNTLKGIFGF